MQRAYNPFPHSDLDKLGPQIKKSNRFSLYSSILMGNSAGMFIFSLSFRRLLVCPVLKCLLGQAMQYATCGTELMKCLFLYVSPVLKSENFFLCSTLGQCLHMVFIHTFICAHRPFYPFPPHSRWQITVN